MMIPDWETPLRLAAAGLLGGVIGYERQTHHKSAGLRTHILVGMGSCLIMILSINIYASVQGLTNADPTRLAAQVVSGIGFLGAGSIMKEGLTVKGLTTAASLWVVSGVGLAIGSGYYVGALATTLFVFITLTALTKIECRSGESGAVSIVITAIDRPGQLGLICTMLGQQGISIADVRIEEHQSDLVLIMTLKLPATVKLPDVVAGLLSLNGVSQVRCEC